MVSSPGSGPSKLWKQWRQRIDLDDYDARFERLAAEGNNIHGEADFITSLVAGLDLQPGNCRLLDAGCGTGRVAIELANRGFPVTAVDNDFEMLMRAEVKDSRIAWHLADISEADLGGPFDLIYMTGNVLVYVEPARRHLVVGNLVSSLTADGVLVSGTGFAPAFDLDAYNDWCRRAGLRLVDHYSTWGQTPFSSGDDYAVTVHRLVSRR